MKPALLPLPPSLPLLRPRPHIFVKLTTYVVWKGGYPIPLEVENMWPKQLSDETWEYGMVPVKGHDP